LIKGFQIILLFSESHSHILKPSFSRSLSPFLSLSLCPPPLSLSLSLSLTLFFSLLLSLTLLLDLSFSMYTFAFLCSPFNALSPSIFSLLCLSFSNFNLIVSVSFYLPLSMLLLASLSAFLLLFYSSLSLSKSLTVCLYVPFQSNSRIFIIPLTFSLSTFLAHS
jgi:hypothetical protein